MALALNKNRRLLSKLAVIAGLLLVIFTKPAYPDGAPVADFFEVIGNILIILCILGRLYCTAFIGGYKNATLITYGPFSMSRNPLYFFSFLGAFGLGVLSGHVTLAIAAPILFCLIYFPVIAREEAYLTQHFGAAYLDYCRKTPRFIPNPWIYYAPETVPMVPKFMLKALRDAVLWFCVFPFFELVEYFHDSGVVPELLVLY